MEVIAVFAIAVGTCLLLAVIDNPDRGRVRYSGPVYDPQRPVTRRVGAMGKNQTGRTCLDCKVTTFGLSDRCGRCDSILVGQR